MIKQIYKKIMTLQFLYIYDLLCFKELNNKSKNLLKIEKD